MKKLIFLFFLGLSLSWIPPGNATNVAEKGTAVQSVMAKDFFIAVQPVTAIGLTLCSVSQSNDQNLEATNDVATAFFLKDIWPVICTETVGVLSFKPPAKLTSSVLNLDSKNQPKDVATIMQSKTPASQPASNQPEYTGSVA